VPKPQPLHGAGLEVLAEHIGRGGQAQHDLQAARVAHIHGQALLVAVEDAEEARARAEQAARGVAALKPLRGIDAAQRNVAFGELAAELRRELLPKPA
jgi:hypothetical protein